MKHANRVWWSRCLVVALGLLGVGLAPLHAQEEPTSSDAAIEQYRAAVAFQNRAVYDLAVGEWQKFLEDHADDPLAPKAQHYLGVCYFQQQKYGEAQAAFEQVVAKHPQFEMLNQTLVNLGLAQFNAGQQGRPGALQQAVDTFAMLLEKFPESKEAPLALYYQGEALYSLENKPAALAAYAALLEQFSEHGLRPKALYGLGVAQEETGAAAAAGQTYDTFLEEFPDHELATEIDMRRGETLLAQEKYEEAEPRFAAAAAVEGFAFADYARLRQAVCQYELKQYAKAGESYAKLVADFPQSPYMATATLAAGKCFFLAGDQPQAQRWLAQAQALGGEAAIEAGHWLARAMLRDGKAAEALEAVEAALPNAAQSPLRADLEMDQADAMYEMADRRGAAVALYAKLAETYPEHSIAPQAAYMAAYGALGVGDHEQALDRAAAFLATFPEHELAPDVQYVQAESQLQLKQYAAAEANYQQLLATQADRPEAGMWMVRRALCQYLQKDYAAVVETLSPQVSSLKTPKLLAEGRFLIGSSLFELEKYADAITALEASLAAATRWRQADETLLVLARAHAEAKDPTAAIATLEKLIDEFPDSQVLDQAYFRLGETQYALGEYPAAAAAYAEVLEHWPDSPMAAYAQLGLGWSHFSQQQYEPAARAMSKLLEQQAEHPLAPRAAYVRAMARQQLGQFEGALADADRYLESEPAGGEKSDILYVRGLSASGLGKFAEAGESFQAILDADPDYAAADKVLYELAWTHLEQDQAAQAARVFARLGKEHPESELAAEALYRLGEHQYQQEEYGPAAVSYYAAFQKAGKSDLGEKAVHKLAWSYFQQQDFERSGQSFRSQIDTYPEGDLKADALAMIGENLFQQQKYADALPALQASLESQPSSEEFRTIALLHAGQAAAQLDDWEQSLKLLEQCASEFPESAYKNEALYEQAWAKQNLGRLDEARQAYEAVAEATDSIVGARARFMLGELQFADKDYEEAIRSFFKVAYGYGYPESPSAYHRWQADATFEAARCCEMIRKLDVAKKLYKEIVDTYPESDKVNEAKEKLASL